MHRKHNALATMDMVNGPLLGKILLFSLPLMASNLLQMLFNAADVVVVGRYAGYGSLAAVGSTSSIVFLVTNLLIGIAVGVNVVLSRDLGQGGRESEISRSLHTAVFLALAGGTAMGLLGSGISGTLAHMVSTPDDIYDLTVLYLRIYFLGTPFVMLYNYGAAALRAVGDTRRPLLYLFLSGITNIVLNLFFVICCHLDVAGVALATVISQMLSAVLVMACLIRTDGPLHFSWKNLRMDLSSLKAMAYVGIPAGIQACLFSLANVMQQGAINSYGSSVIVAGSSAAASVENFIYVSMNSYHQAAQTFISQNMGAGKPERVTTVFRLCQACTLAIGGTLSAIILLFGPQFISIYNSDPAVIEQGVLRLSVIVAPYVLFGMADVLVGSIRGYGYPIIPVVINLLGTCVLRVLWCVLLDTSRYGVEYVYLSYPVSWLAILVALAVFWIYLRRRDSRRSGSSISPGLHLRLAKSHA